MNLNSSLYMSNQLLQLTQKTVLFKSNKETVHILWCKNWVRGISSDTKRDIVLNFNNFIKTDLRHFNYVNELLMVWLKFLNR